MSLDRPKNRIRKREQPTWEDQRHGGQQYRSSTDLTTAAAPPKRRSTASSGGGKLTRSVSDAGDRDKPLASGDGGDAKRSISLFGTIQRIKTKIKKRPTAMAVDRSSEPSAAAVTPGPSPPPAPVRAKKQLSPIIESSPRDEYFKYSVGGPLDYSGASPPRPVRGHKVDRIVRKLQQQQQHHHHHQQQQQQHKNQHNHNLHNQQQQRQHQQQQHRRRQRQLQQQQQQQPVCLAARSNASAAVINHSINNNNNNINNNHSSTRNKRKNFQPRNISYTQDAAEDGGDGGAGGDSAAAGGDSSTAAAVLDLSACTGSTVAKRPRVDDGSAPMDLTCAVPQPPNQVPTAGAVPADKRPSTVAAAAAAAAHGVQHLLAAAAAAAGHHGHHQPHDATDLKEYAQNTVRELLEIYGLNTDVADAITNNVPMVNFSTGKSKVTILLHT